MSISINPAYAYCKNQDWYVSLEQTEGECRDRHNCGDAACPLEAELGKKQFSRALNMLASSFGQVLECK